MDVRERKKKVVEDASKSLRESATMQQPVKEEGDFEVTWIDNNGFKGIRKLDSTDQVCDIAEYNASCYITTFIKIHNPSRNLFERLIHLAHEIGCITFMIPLYLDSEENKCRRILFTNDPQYSPK